MRRKPAMRTRLGLMTIVTWALGGSSIAVADTLDDQTKAMTLITDTANKICNVVQTEGTTKGSRVQGQVKAELGGLASKLADVGISGSGEFKDESYGGVLQADLATALKNSADCKLEVFKILQSKMILGQANVVGQTDMAFTRPTIGNLPVDWCYGPATDCGGRAADQFCRSQGYGGAVSFSLQMDVGRTRIIGDNSICEPPRFARCDGFATVMCKKG